jgi:hypothetical protein
MFCRRDIFFSIAVARGTTEQQTHARAPRKRFIIFFSVNEEVLSSPPRKALPRLTDALLTSVLPASIRIVMFEFAVHRKLGQIMVVFFPRRPEFFHLFFCKASCRREF